MKKVLLLIIVSIVSVYAYAQDDSLAVSKIDSLSLKLTKLQHDYDYLSCDYDLEKVKMGLTDLAHNINIKGNQVSISVYHERYDRDFYALLTKDYDVTCTLFDAIKDNYESVKEFVMLKILASDFSDIDLRVIKSSINTIDQCVESVKSALACYDAVIQDYRDKR